MNEMVLIDDASSGFVTAELVWNENTGRFYDKNNIEVPNRDLSEYLYRVQVINASSGQITFRHHLTATLEDENKEEVGRKLFLPNTIVGIKVQISVLGEISPA